ncbi:TetR/AcrR family transcriptional regulator [Novosphingobium sp.]|uniref:TetR/AcrR family transcriptional regulator n=1 Tax=Novosphingobium sp. TaxID=1874826 RepID=UPI002FDE0B6A
MASAKPTYHRENLKEELLAAAVIYIAEHGHQDLSVRKLSQIVGVSPGAPYHHFPDRRSLLIAVALQGYEQLVGSAMADAGLHLDGPDILYNVCSSFLRFARDNRRMMELMYDSELARPALEPAILAAQQRGYQMFRNAVKLAGPALPADSVSACVATIWSAMFGYALMRYRDMIHAEEEIGEKGLDAAADAVVRQAIRLATG